jgi:hypothetical protein
VDGTVTKAMATAEVVELAVAASASAPSTAPVAAFVKVTVPVGLTPLGTLVIATEMRTFCPGCTVVRVEADTPVTFACEIVTDSPLERLGAKVASPA